MRVAFRPASARRAVAGTMLAAVVAVGALTPASVRADEPVVSATEHGVDVQRLERYLRALYARDAAATYAELSPLDRVVKTHAEYEAESGAMTGRPLEFSRQLAEHVAVRVSAVEVEGDLATVTLDARLPDANSGLVRELGDGFDTARLDALTAAQFAQRLARVRAHAGAGTLPMLSAAGETWQMVRADGEWRVFENWASAVEVRFGAFTSHELQWRFEPVRSRVFALHGDTVQMAYRATNIGPFASTGKARHVVAPTADAQHLEIVSCFCFMEQTLEPGESVELPLVFRVDFDAPDELALLDVRYEFHLADAFPRGGSGADVARVVAAPSQVH